MSLSDTMGPEHFLMSIHTTSLLLFIGSVQAAPQLEPRINGDPVALISPLSKGQTTSSQTVLASPSGPTSLPAAVSHRQVGANVVAAPAVVVVPDSAHHSCHASDGESAVKDPPRVSESTAILGSGNMLPVLSILVLFCGMTIGWICESFHVDL
ncbi:hypothetical protein C8Q77DRAFT_133793 [Trametes polyzona]|nr:hypothetical protein C8Q77DRAFT_133793 [Trametes polyzona]